MLPEASRRAAGYAWAVRLGSPPGQCPRSWCLCSCSRDASAEAAEVIHHPHSLLSTLVTAVSVWVFFSLRGIESGKAFTGTLVLLQVGG